MNDSSGNEFLTEDALEEAKVEYKRNNPDSFVEHNWEEIILE